MQQLGMFAKYWQPGAVKTRLARTVGNMAAARLYRIFVQTLLHRFGTTADLRQLVYTPSGREHVFRVLAGDAWQLDTQGDGSLGERMERYFARSLAAGVERIVLIGSDSPNLPDALVEEAFERLRSHDVVLGPSDDGGYFLVGICGRLPDMFQDVDWGTPRVWQQTVERLEQRSVRYARLPGWYDVDVWEDVKRLAEDLNAAKGPPEDLTELRNAVTALIVEYEG